MCASKMLYTHRPEVIDSAGLSPDVVAALRALPAVWQKRRAIQRQRVVPFADLARHMSPLRSPLSVLRRARSLPGP